MALAAKIYFLNNFIIIYYVFPNGNYFFTYDELFPGKLIVIQFR